jgi:aldehyde dehydrogenase (NAD+)
VIVDKRVHDELLSKLVARVESLRLGDGLDPATDVGPVINSKAVDKIDGYANASRGVGQGEGARVLTGGEIARDGDLGRGHFYRPTVLADVEPGMRVAQEEIFGPVTSVIRCDGFEDAVRIANGIEYGLSSAIYTADVNNAFRAMRDLDTGITYINAGTTGAEVHLPFGGVKATGNGHREAGTAALDTYTEWKSIYVDYSGHLQRAQIDNQ